jgi:hypothetical protein
MSEQVVHVDDVALDAARNILDTDDIHDAVNAGSIRWPGTQAAQHRQADQASAGIAGRTRPTAKDARLPASAKGIAVSGQNKGAR